MKRIGWTAAVVAMVMGVGFTHGAAGTAPARTTASAAPAAQPVLATPAPPASGMGPAAARPARGTHYVYLIRHGMYDRDTTADDAVGNGLNALGHEQAKLVGARLAALPVKVRLLVSSPYTRARETADDIGALLGMPATRDTLLHECTPHFAHRPEYALHGDEDERLACEANLNTAFARYFTPTPEADTHDVLVAHGNVIRWLVCKAIGLDPLQWQHFEIANGSLTILAVRSDGTITLVEFSDTGHLPVDKQTWTGRGAGWGAKR